MRKQARRIAFFGGSFDPPHAAHAEAVSFALSSSEIDYVLVVPVYRHAFDKELTPFADRVLMLRAMPWPWDKVEISELEADLPEPNYTISTIRRLRELQPGDEFRLLVGADVVNESSKWRSFDELTKLAPLLVLGRVGTHAPGAPEPSLPNVSSTEVRRWLRRDEETERLLQLVPRSVLQVICERGLYGVSATSLLSKRVLANPTRS